MVKLAGRPGHRRRRMVAFRSRPLEALESRVTPADGISPMPGPPLHAIAGRPLSDAVFATYTVIDPTSGPGDQWRGLINFGDGQADGPLIPAEEGAGFEFVDTHTYRLPGTYTVTVMIAVPGSHRPNDNTVTTTVTVAASPGAPTPTPTAPSPSLGATGLSLKAGKNRAFHGSVATIDEAGANARGFTALVDWGDQLTPEPGRYPRPRPRALRRHRLAPLPRGGDLLHQRGDPRCVGTAGHRHEPDARGLPIARRARREPGATGRDP